jgi:hypothetical protein
MNKDQERYKRTRDKVVRELGGKCACGFTDTRALQIDHINGGGGDDRRKFGGRWRLFYEYVAANPLKFQILCANCNAIKRIENSEHRAPAPVTEPCTAPGC